MSTMNLRRLRRRSTAAIIVLLLAVLPALEARRTAQAQDLEQLLSAANPSAPLKAHPGEEAAVAAINAAGPKSTGQQYEDRLYDVVLEGPTVDDSTVAALRGLPELRTLRLVGPGITDAGLSVLATCPALNSLVLSETRVTAVGAARLTELKKLKTLTLHRTKIGDLGLVALADCPELTTLSLSEIGGSAAGLRALGRFPLLKQLILRDPSIQNRAADEPVLQTCRDVAAAYLGFGSALLQWRPDVERYIVNDSLAALVECRNLRSLDLAHTTKLTAAGLRSLAQLPQLQSLDLQATRTNDAGLAELARIAGLERLELSDTPITDDGLAHLAALKNLTVLSVSRTQVSSAGLDSLHGLKRLKIWAADTQIGKKGKRDWEARSKRMRSPLEELQRREYKGDAASFQERILRERFAGGETEKFVAAVAADEELLNVRLPWFKDADGVLFVDCAAIHIAVVHDDLAAARRLLERGSSVLITDRHRRTPLMLARSPAMVKLLLEYGAVVEPEARRSDSALFHARSAEIATILLDHGAQVRRIGYHGRTALHEAARQGRSDVVKLLLARGAEVDARHRFDLRELLQYQIDQAEDRAGYFFNDGSLNLSTFSGSFIQHDGVWEIWNSFQVIRRRHRRFPRTDSPLTEAATADRVDVARVLLQHGATCDFADEAGGRALENAVERGSPQLVRMLLERGAKPTTARRSAADLLLKAITWHRDVEIVRMLLDAGAPMNFRYANSDDPFAFFRSDDRDAIDFRNWTPLHYAAHHGQEAAVQLLLERGADPHARSTSGRTPLECTSHVESKPMRFVSYSVLPQESAAVIAARVDAAILARSEARVRIRELLESVQAQTKPIAAAK